MCYQAPPVMLMTLKPGTRALLGREWPEQGVLGSGSAVTEPILRGPFSRTVVSGAGSTMAHGGTRGTIRKMVKDFLILSDVSLYVLYIRISVYM